MDKTWYDPVCIFGHLVKICDDEADKKHIYGDTIINKLNLRKKPWHQYTILHLPPESYSHWGGYDIKDEPGCITVVVGIEIGNTRITLEEINRLSANLELWLKEGDWNELEGKEKEATFMIGICYSYDTGQPQEKEGYTMVYGYNLSKEFSSSQQTDMIRSFQTKRELPSAKWVAYMALSVSGEENAVATDESEATFDILGYYDTPECLPIFLLGSTDKQKCSEALEKAVENGNRYAVEIKKRRLVPDVYQVKNS